MSHCRLLVAVLACAAARVGAAAPGCAAGASPTAVDGARVVAAAEQALRDWLRPRSERIAVQPLAAPAAPALPCGDVRLAARALPRASASLPRRVQVWIDVAVDGRFVRTLPVAFALQAHAPAWVARADAPAGQALQADDFERREVDVTGLREPPVGSWPTSSRLRRPLLAGQVLTASQVAAAPAVARGERVAVRSRRGDIALEAVGEALQDGVPGARILVRIARSSGPLAARVVSAGVVEVRP